MATASSSCVGRNVSRNGPSVSTPTSGAPGQSQPMVVVWEWQDDLGVWRPYSGQVSGYIEQCFSSPRGHRGGSPGSTSIWLGQSDPSLSPYLIDIPSLKQFRQDTGKEIKPLHYYVCFILQLNGSLRALVYALVSAALDS